MDSPEEPISKRSRKLDSMILDHLYKSINRDTLLDAFNVLFEESSSDVLRKEPNFSSFREKFHDSYGEIKKLRVSLSDFEVKNVIGQGHFGEVQVVAEKRNGDFYAMKTMRKDDTLSQKHTAFYEEERDIMAKSTSPWITKLKYAFQDYQNLYLVMEFHPGGDLLGLLNRNDDVIPEKMAQFYLAELVEAIHSLHKMGYVHRDVKPDNVLIDRAGHIKLADFGSAAKLVNNGKVCSVMPVGTPDYISPELLAAMNDYGTTYGITRKSMLKSYGIECDWWSLGVVAFQMLYGETPFADDKVITTYSNIMNFKRTLKFPCAGDAKENVSDVAISFIRCLLDDRESRFGYEKLCQHRFFININWNNLLQSIPPFVPAIDGNDDTSNFEEFDREPQRFLANNLSSSKRQFSGRNLPFVGFTYDHNASRKNLNSDKRSSIHNVSFESSFSESPSSRNRINNLEVQLANKKKEILGLQKRLCDLEVHDKFKESVEKDAEIKDLIAELEKTKSLFEREKSSLLNDVTYTKRMLNAERQSRIASENKACTLVQAIKLKYQEQVDLKQEELVEAWKSRDVAGNVSAQAREKFREQCEEIESLKCELNEYKSLYESYKNKHKIQTNRKEGLEGLHDKLEKLSQDTGSQISTLQSKLHQAENDKEEAEVKVRDLQSKLVEMSSIESRADDDHVEFNDLHEKLKQTQDYCVRLEGKLEDFKQNQEKTEDLRDRLQARIKENQQLRLDYSDLEMKASKYVDQLEDMHSDFVERNQEAEEKVRGLETELGFIKNEKFKVEDDLKNVRRQEIGVKEQLKNLQSVQTKLENNLNSLENEAKDSVAVFNHEETDLRKDNLYLKQKLLLLESKSGRRQSMDDKSSSDVGDKLFETQEHLRKKEKEVHDCNIDLRIKTRENKSLEERLQWAREMQKELREKLKVADHKVSSLESSDTKMKTKLGQLESQIAEKVKVVDNITKDHQIEKEKLCGKIETLQESRDVTKNLEQQSARIQGQYDEICKQNEVLSSKLKNVEQETDRLIRDKKSLIIENSERTRKLENLEMNINVLKSTCVVLEEQIQDFETLLGAHEEIKDKLDAEIKTSKTKIYSLTSELTKEKHSNEKIKSESDIIAEKLKDLKNKMKMQSELHQSECDAYDVNIEKLREQITLLTNELNECERNLSEDKMTNANLKQKIVHFDRSNIEIKEEAAKHMNQISSLKQSNLKLTQALGESLDAYEAKKDELHDLRSDIDNLVFNAKQDKIKMMATISQQAKLIDFLQQKTEFLEGKKKKGLFSGAKMPKMDYNTLPMQWRDMEEMLRKERQRVRNLQEQLKKSRSEAMRKYSPFARDDSGNELSVKKSVVPTSPKTRAVLSALVSSPGSNNRGDDDDCSSPCDDVTSSLRVPQKQRMHHNIPHRFHQMLAMRGTKCVACLDTIHLGRQAMKCHECEIVCHVKCVHAVPSTCGLPAALVDHFTSTVAKGLPSSPSIIVERDSDLYEGWVKVPRLPGKNGWERRYAQLDQHELKTFDKENVDSKPLEKYNLRATDRCRQIVVAGAVPRSELVSTAKSDIPFILKIEWISATTCWPGRVLYVMAESLSQKQLWVAALEAVIKKNSVGSDTVRLSSTSNDSKMFGNVILNLRNENRIDVNCSSVYKDKWLLLGATEGLFAFDLENDSSKRKPSRVDGIDSVFQIVSIDVVGIVLLLVGNSRELTFTRHADLMDALEHDGNKLKPVKLGDVDNCHLASAGYKNVDRIFVACANSDLVSLYKYDDGYADGYAAFILKKTISTPEPCSCMLFTRHTLLYGANRFYEVDLQDFFVEEFLDESDSSLAFAVYGASKLESFPMSIFQTSEKSDAEDEFLLCYHDFGVFVDGFGRRCRDDDLKWSKLPLALAYNAPYLYIVHFTCIEICVVCAKQELPRRSRVSIELTNPRYLGPAITPEAIYIACVNDEDDGESVDVMCIRGNVSTSEADRKSLTNSSGTEISDLEMPNVDDISSLEGTVQDFSFTDSLVASLDDRSTVD